MAATNFDGKPVAVNDQVTIIGLVTAVSGSGGLATITVIPTTAIGTATISAKANDMNSVDGPNDASHPATGIAGQFFGVGDNVSVLGKVTAISGSGTYASLTVTLINSGNSVTVPSSSVRSAQFNG